MSSGTRADADAMGLALGQAQLALAAEEVPVGAVVLSPSGSVLGLGHNQRRLPADPTGHAEVLALRVAALALGDWQLLDCPWW